MSSTFQLDILAAEGPFFSGACESIVVPTPEGQRGILAHRANIISAIVPGKLTFRTPDGQEHRAAVSSGMIKANRARLAEARAREELLQKRSLREYRMAEANLARALNRLRVSRG